MDISVDKTRRNSDNNRDKFPKSLKIIFDKPFITNCHIVTLMNCLSFCADIILDDNHVKILSSYAVGKYKYKVCDPITLEDGNEIFESTYYNCRLYSLQINRRKNVIKSANHSSNLASIDLFNLNLLTSGNFKCVLYGVDQDNQLVIDLINTVSGLSVADYFLSYYSDHIIRYKELK